jgi:hypothetical protein
MGRWPAIRGALIISFLSEVMQVFTEGRSPTLVDVAANVLGALIGALIYGARKNEPIRIAASFRAALIATVLGTGTVLMLGAQMTPERLEDLVAANVAAPPWRPTNVRGSRAPGTLEGLWTFDRVSHDAPLDESSNHLDGVLVNDPSLVPGVEGQALALNGIDQWLDLGDPVALRLTGSMTITAWINSTTFPRDDAAIVSDHSGLGYQLDTTIDQGSRTIGFKLADAAGQLMMRYGRTPLVTDRWYHVAGVYDAPARSMNVYLNGRLDNGCLSGHVTARQQTSGKKAFVGRRGGQSGFEFAGAIDDVRIYSRALTALEIIEQIEHAMATSTVVPSMDDLNQRGNAQMRPADEACGRDSFDARVAGLVVAFGMLVAVVCVAILPSAQLRVWTTTLSLLAGVLLVPSLAPITPAHFRWLAPLLTCAGGFSMVASVPQRAASTD